MLFQFQKPNSYSGKSFELQIKIKKKSIDRYKPQLKIIQIII